MIASSALGTMSSITSQIDSLQGLCSCTQEGLYQVTQVQPKDLIAAGAVIFRGLLKI